MCWLLNPIPASAKDPPQPYQTNIQSNKSRRSYGLGIRNGLIHNSKSFKKDSKKSLKTHSLTQHNSGADRREREEWQFSPLVYVQNIHAMLWSGTGKQALNWQLLWKAVFMYRGYTESTIRYSTNSIKRRCKYISGITFYISQYIYTCIQIYMCVLLATGTQTCTYTWPENTHTRTTHQLYTLLEGSLSLTDQRSMLWMCEDDGGWWQSQT